MFYHFDQNNSGGEFHGPARNVFIEALDSGHANQIAESIGIYFDGVDMGYDCPCCGNRWNPVYRYESMSFEDVTTFIQTRSYADDRMVFAAVYFLNGNVVKTKE